MEKTIDRVHPVAVCSYFGSGVDSLAEPERMNAMVHFVQFLQSEIFVQLAVELAEVQTDCVVACVVMENACSLPWLGWADSPLAHVVAAAQVGLD